MRSNTVNLAVTMCKLILVTCCAISIGYPQSRLAAHRIEEIVALPEESIDIGTACLILAKDVFPSLQIERFDYVLDYMAERIRMLSQGSSDPLARIGLLNTYFFKPGWWNDSITFNYDLNDLEAQQKGNRYLNGIISTKRGSCVTMSMLYLAVACRLGWPIVPVRSAKHVFCRYLDPQLEENNIEPTCGGGFLADSQYIVQAGIPQEALTNGVYMRNLTKKQYIGTLLSNHALQLLEEGDFDKSYHYFQLSIELDSTFSTGYWNLGQWHYRKAAALQKQLESILMTEQALYEIETRSLSADKTPIALRNPVRQQPGAVTVDRRIEESKNSARVPDPRLPFAVSPPGTPVDPLARRSAVNSEMERLKVQFGGEIRKHLSMWEGYRKKARELGIVLKFPDEFFIRQADAIEKFKRTGEY